MIKNWEVMKNMPSMQNWKQKLNFLFYFLKKWKISVEYGEICLFYYVFGAGEYLFLALLSELSFKLLQVAFIKSTHVLGTPQLGLNWMT